MERPGAPLDLQHSIQISPQEPWVKLTANSKLVDFLVDTGGSKLHAKTLSSVFEKTPMLGKTEGGRRRDDRG